jgi:glycosyltransferase involved in cell wall biosynthesis
MAESKKVRILFINLRSDYGGGPSHMFDLVTSLSSSFEKYVACPIQKPFYNLYEERKITVFPLPFRSFSVLSFFKLVCFTKRNYIDIIHSHGKGAGIYSRLLRFFTRKPVIHTFHGFHYKKYSYWLQKLYFITERRLSQLTECIINVSDSENDEGLQLRLFSKSKARVIYNGINFEKMWKSKIDLELRDLINSIKKDNVLICTVARFDYVKGIDVAIKAIKCLKEYHKTFKYILIGDGELRGEIVKEINNYHLNDHVILLGFRDDVPGILRVMDIYLSPSRSESMSLTLLEAMNAGLPVVASDVMGNRNLIKNGLLAKSECPIDIARKLSTLIENPQLRDRLAKEGRATVKENYSLERMVHDTEYLYYDVLNAKRLQSPSLGLSKARNMRVGINASKFFEVNTGVGRYTSNLCKYILEADGKNDYFLYSPSQMGIVIRTDRTKIQFKKSGIAPKNNTLRILWEQVTLPYYSMNDRLDLFHYTDHSLSILKRTHPVIITVHDIAYVRFPNLLNKSRRIYKKNILKMSIKKADIIVADSYSTKRDIIEFFNVEEKKIKVVYLGVEYRFRPISNVEEYRLRNNLPSKMILNVGTLEPRKNIVALIRAFKKLKGRGLKDYKLVIAGDKGWLYKQIFKEIESNDLQKEVLFLGIVEDEDLPMLYNCADIFVYPSLYEGFGLPPLEAMACGIPVITSNTSSLPEVVGNAGIMVDPDDVNSLCEAMYNVLKDKELWHQMSKKGLERAKLFPWEDTAKKVLEIYDLAIAKNNHK